MLFCLEGFGARLWTVILSQTLIELQGGEMGMYSTEFFVSRRWMFIVVAAFFSPLHFGYAYTSTDIIEAVMSADSSAVASMTQESPDALMIAADGGNLPIHAACELGYTGIARHLIDSGSPVDCPDSGGCIPLHRAARAGQSETVRLLIASGSPLSAQDRNGKTPLAYALMNRDRESAGVLLDHGASCRFPDEEKVEILFAAAELGLEIFVDSTLSSLEDKSIRRSDGGTLLHAVSEGGICKVASALIDSGASLIDRNIYGQTPLHTAASRGHADMIELLLARGAYIDARDAAGFTPLHYSQAVKHDAVTRLLISRGADVSGGRFRELRGEYISKDPPACNPEPYAPGIISSSDEESGGVWISSSGEELYFSRVSANKDRGSIFLMKYRNGRWSQPRPISFSSDVCHDCSPALSHDGTRLFFCSCRKRSGNGHTSASIWMSERSTGGWEQPKPVRGEFVHIPSEGGIAISERGCLYFPAKRQDGLGSCDIYMAERTEDGYTEEAVNLGPNVNTRYGECCSYVDSNERYLIFASDRPGGYGSWDLYISMRLEDGSWSEARNMGERINTPSDERNATVSPDGTVLFFLTDRNGNLDYYWVQVDLAEIMDTETS